METALTTLRKDWLPMKTYDLFDYLKGKTYPGRGILIGTSRDGGHGLIAYFIMGRSENSRNRIFAAEGDGLRTQAKDPSRMTDPSLIIYSPVRVLDHRTIVTNGDQTDTVFEAMSLGKTFPEALSGRTFEPDAPNYTPRISGILYQQGEASSYCLSILKSANGDPGACERLYYCYENKLPGLGHLIHTYEENRDPLPSFEGEPRRVMIPFDGKEDPSNFAQSLFESLDPDNRISLFVRVVDLADGSFRSAIING